MNIAVFGYYNFFNAGDDRIQHCLKRIFQGHIITFLPHFLPPPHLNYLNTFDWIIIGGGGLVRERVGIWVDMQQWLKNVRANIGVIGLGINSLTPKLSCEVFSLLNHTKFFWVRDHKSKLLLNNDSRVEVHPDLTWCFPLTNKNINQENTNQDRQNIAVNLTPCAGKLNTEQWLEQIDHSLLEPFPLYFTKNRDYQLLRKHFGERTPKEFTIEPLTNSKMLIACRYHAIVFAMQLGIPFIAINYDDKVKRLLVESNLADFCLELNQANLLTQKINDLETNLVAVQAKIEIYCSQQKQLAQIMLKQLEHLLELTPLVEHPRTIVKRKVKRLLHLG